MRRFGIWSLRIVAVLLLAGVAIWGMAHHALSDLDRAISAGDHDHELSAPKAAGLFLAAQVLPLRQPGGPVTEPGRSFHDCEDCPELVEIPPGMFLFGSPLFEPGRYEHVWRRPIRKQLKFANREGPRYLVRIDYSFALARYELTFGEWDRAQADPDWERFSGMAPHLPARPQDASPDMAVTNIDQHDAQAYAKWLSAKTGQIYRLPTEAEWEYAARAGTATVYPWGDEIEHDMAVCAGCSSIWPQLAVGPVGLHPPNGFGLHDMIGNGWEWVADCFEPWHDEAQLHGSAFLYEGCEFAAIKGGSAHEKPWQLRSAMRVGPHPHNDGEGSTIRLLRELPQR